ncbi:MAG: ribosome biogenesis GTP-binding protein YihA/YsxC [Pseudomonadota bacterium]
MKPDDTADADFTDDEIETGRKLFAGPVTFVKGVVDLAYLPPGDRNEVAFAGRSNVGKSSLINALVGRKALARTSAEPGKTREINYFDLGEGSAWLVDLPGFGYAKVSKSQAAQWMALTKDYLRGRAALRRVFLLVDIRRGLMPTDTDVMALLDQAAVNYQIVLTKADKVKPTRASFLKGEIEGELKRHAAAHPQVRVTSSEKGQGLPELRAEIANLT